MKKLCCVICGKYRKFKDPKISYIFKISLVLSIFAVSAIVKIKKYFKKKNQLKLLV